MTITSITVYANVHSADLRERIDQLTGRVSQRRVVSCQGDFVHTWFADPIRARSDGDFVCYISEDQTFEDADVAFAVFHCRFPTLLLGCPTEAALDSPLVTRLGGDASMDEKLQCLDTFFPTAHNEGRVVVLEGGDGAGKATQTSLLVAHMRRDGKSVHTLDFPYEPGLYGSLVRIILSGKKGGIAELDPRLFSFIYSLNRYGCLPELRLWMQRGSVVVLDRYYTANFGHQASKLPEEKRKEFIHHLEKTEVCWLGLPAAQTVFYLDLPPQAALEAMKKDATRQYLDIHETASGNYKENVRQTYLWCCDNLPGWNRVLCFDTVRCSRLPREDVHEKIYRASACSPSQTGTIDRLIDR